MKIMIQLKKFIMGNFFGERIYRKRNKNSNFHFLSIKEKIFRKFISIDIRRTFCGENLERKILGGFALSSILLIKALKTELTY